MVSLACLAFALGSGAGAYLASAQYQPADDDRLVVDYATSEDAYGFTSRGPELSILELPPAVRPAAATPAEADDQNVHTVARALSVQTPAAGRPVIPVASVSPEAWRPLVPPASVAAVPGALLPAQVTFYYCAGGGAGDGGGFCGNTADGTPVQIGVAACDRALMGQQFRVVGDPSGLVFRCSDTGGGVYGSLRDIWFPTAASGGAWLAGVGHNVTIELVH